MNFRTKLIDLAACVALGAGAATCLAAPQDTITFTNQVSDGLNGSALNQVDQTSIANTYPVHRVRVNGTLVSGGVNSYESEARILVTPPTGSPFVLQPFSVPAAFGTVTTPVGGYVYDLPSAVPSSHGVWTWRFYESYDDPGVDATWSTISFTLDDGTGQTTIEAHPTAPTAIAGLQGSLVSMYLVPGTNPASTNMAVTMDLTYLGGSATQALYDDGTHGDLVAGDHVYSFLCSPAESIPGGTYAINYQATDAQGRSVTGSFPLVVQGMMDVGPMVSGFETSVEGLGLFAGGVQWFRVSIDHPIADASHTWFDAWTSAPVGGDTEIALYNAAGQLVTFDDDDGDGLLSALSFGQVSPARNWFGADGVPGNGRDGSLAAGTYYLAMGTYPMTFGASGFAVSGTGPLFTGGQLNVAVDYDVPVVFGQTVTAQPQGTALITAQAIPAENPVSQGMTVTANLSLIGGAVGALMYDDGTHGDLVAGDHVFSRSVVLPAGYGEGTYNIPLVVTDSLQRQSGGTAVVNVDLAGDTIATAWPLEGPGAILAVSGALTTDDADMYRIHICDPTHFSARVTGGTIYDPQLFLFRPDGHGVVSNDDDPAGGYLSVIDGPIATSIPAGDYYLAISGYDKDPVDASQQLLWADFPFTLIHAPDGPGAANPMAGWNHNASSIGTYVISLTGISGTACAPHCGSPDFNCDGAVGTDADIESFFQCLAGSCPPPPCTSTADFNGDGSVGTDADIEAFFRVLAGGTC
jgi:hypothetical protein